MCVVRVPITSTGLSLPQKRSESQPRDRPIRFSGCDESDLVPDSVVPRIRTRKGWGGRSLGFAHQSTRVYGRRRRASVSRARPQPPSFVSSAPVGRSTGPSLFFLVRPFTPTCLPVGPVSSPEDLWSLYLCISKDPILNLLSYPSL